MGKLSVLPKQWQFFVIQCPSLHLAPGSYDIDEDYMSESGTQLSVTYGFFYSQIWGIDKTNKQKTAEDSFIAQSMLITQG